MVDYTTIQTRNVHFGSQNHTNHVCVFAGATSGIGAGTLEKLASMLHKPTLYILGRSAARFNANQRPKLETLSPGAKIVFIEVEISLLSEVDKACDRILEQESRVDMLYMSPGVIPLDRPEYTKEGLDICFALTYYTRLRLTTNLLPLLSHSDNPRVVSVLSAGNEGPFTKTSTTSSTPDNTIEGYDVGLSDPTNHTPLSVIDHTTTLTTLSFDHLASTSRGISFIHAFPGWVQTDIFARLSAPSGSSVLWRIGLAVVQGFASLMMATVGVSAGESGERHAYLLTAAEEDFKGAAAGSWRVGKDSEIVATESKALREYRNGGWPEKVWEFTVRAFERALQ